MWVGNAGDSLSEICSLWSTQDPFPLGDDEVRVPKSLSAPLQCVLVSRVVSNTKH